MVALEQEFSLVGDHLQIFLKKVKKRPDHLFLEKYQKTELIYFRFWKLYEQVQKFNSKELKKVFVLMMSQSLLISFKFQYKAKIFVGGTRVEKAIG